MVNDPLGDFIIRLKNAGAAKHESVSLPYSKLKNAVAEVLQQAGYIKSLDKRGKKVRKVLEVQLLYKKDGSPRINEVKRISKPGRRIYKSVKKVFPVRYGKGSLILSTSKGVMIDKEAREKELGGEVLFEIY